MADVDELVRKLGDTDPKVRMYAARALENAAYYRADITIVISALAEALSDKDARVRCSAAEALGSAARPGVDMTVAMSALAAALSDKNASVQSCAASALGYAAQYGAGMTVAILALAKALSDKISGVRWNAASALGKAIEKCATIEALDEMETRLRGEHGALKEKYRYGKEAELARLGSAFSKLISEAARRRDALVPERDILLDDLPKPPKKGRGEIYCQMRRVTNG
jgi:HEAT repeat protein